MKVFGLTGGVGMGKTASERFLRSSGVPVVDTDVLARQIVEPGQPAWEEIKRSFGDEIVGSDGGLCRERLAQIVFSDAAARRKLEAITHPRIRERWLGQIEKWRAEGRSRAVVVVPLLFETNSESQCDASICVACTAATQRRRLLGRGWSADQINQRNAAQWPIEKKMALADYVVWTEGGLDVLAGQLQRIIGAQ